MADTEMASVLAAAHNSAWLSHQDPMFREKLLRNAKLVKFSKNERIIRLDEKGSNLYFLFEGAIQVLTSRANLEVILSDVVSPLEWFGEYGAFTERNNIMEYRARTASVALVVLRSRLIALGEDSCFRRAAIDILANSVKRCLELSAGLAGLDGEERVRSKLHALTGTSYDATYKGLRIVISHEELASISCVSRTVVANVLSRLSNDNIIATGYRSIVVLQRERLLG